MQAWFFLIRRGLGYRKVRVTSQALTTNSIELAPPIRVFGQYRFPGIFRFQNRAQSLCSSTGSIDWSAERAKKLWQFHLHYFDYLRQPGCQVGDQLIDSWIEAHPQGAMPAWEPFTTSLRIVNWVFWLVQHPEHQNEKILRSLFLQARWLEKNDERHILANHYFENLKALMFVDCFFSEANTVAAKQRVFAAVEQQLQEQFLQDGGHYERSPMYHCAMLENLLDLQNLVCALPHEFDDGFKSLLQARIVAALRWLQGVIKPDGSIPLFNDAAIGQCATPAALTAYAQRLGFDTQTVIDQGDAVVALNESGLYGYRAAGDYLMMDCGDIGPRYQPGHTHCDMLSFELTLRGIPIVVDTGTYEYQPGDIRHYCRSTAAHNTFVVDDSEQSEIWGEFRVARRAAKRSGGISKLPSGIALEGEFFGFQAIGGVTHKRVCELAYAQHSNQIESIKFKDTFYANKTRSEVELVGRLLFHPNVHAVLVASNRVVITANCAANDELRAELLFDEGLMLSLEKREYFPRFGIKQACQGLKFAWSGRLPFESQFQLTVLESTK